MNRGVLHQSSPVQQLMAASGGPNWWNINTNIVRPSPPPPQNNNFRQHAPPPSSSSWHQDNQVLPESWSQLLMGGLVVEEGKSLSSSSSSSSSAGNLSHIHQQAKKLEIWEEQVVMSHDPINSVDHHVKQEKSPNVSHDHRVYENINSTAELIQAAAAAKPTWFDHQNMPVSSSPKSCVTSLSSNMLDFSNNKADDRRHPPPDHHSSECNSTATGGAAKKARVESSSSSTHSTFNVRKEKLGDRITALHQIVSPFGKTDTASVLFEVLGYVKFLQSQIEALSLPYQATGSGNNMSQQQPESLKEAKKDLRSRGLCLVPILLTLQVGSETSGANYWAPPAL